MKYRGRVWLVMMALGTTALVPAPSASAATRTFGANLRRVPDNLYTCGSFGFTPTCTWESIDLTTGESGFPFIGRGVVTRVSVRVGPVTGPMQIVEEEALRTINPANYYCCKAIRVSRVFTPRPNRITTIAVNFPVTQSRRPNRAGFYVDDHLALSILDQNVPIPAASDANATLSGWFPAWSRGQESCCPFGSSGFTILLRANWTPV